MNPTKSIAALRNDFPILSRKLYDNRPLIYFDNAASVQKPKIVLDAMQHFYENDYSNVHRGIHYLSAKATEQFEFVRDKVRDFIHAPLSSEIIFVKGSTEGINLIAHSYGLQNIKAGDDIIISHMEHHANIVPWQILCESTGAHLKIIPIFNDGTLNMDAYQQLLSNKTKIVAITHVSNSLGTINPIQEIINLAHNVGAIVVVDGAQAVPHFSVDVQKLDCDFYVFSAHKIFGPTGVGILYGKKHLLDKMPPYQTGGNMINEVHFEKTTYQNTPHKFEPGTPNIAGVIGLGAAIDYMKTLPWDLIVPYENHLLHYATNALQALDNIQLFGTAPEKVPLISFTLGNVHAHDVGTFLDRSGVAVRSGHHCTMPLWEYFKVSSTTRMSFAFYNTTTEIDTAVETLLQTQELFA